MSVKRTAKDAFKLSHVAELMDEYTRMENDAYHQVLLKKQKKMDELESKVRSLMNLVNNLQDQNHMLRAYIAEHEPIEIIDLTTEEEVMTETDEETRTFMDELMDM